MLSRPRIWPWAAAVAAGIFAARAGLGDAAGWVCLGAGGLVLAACPWRRETGWAVAACACVACFGLGVLRGDMARNRLPADSILRFVGEERRLLRVSGVAACDAEPGAPDSGEFAPFAHHEPVRRFQLEVRRVEAGGGAEPASGLLAVTQEDGAAPIHAGDRIEALGWISALRPPLNPGEFDMAEHLRQKGVAARFFAGTARVADPAPAASLARLRSAAAARAQASLAAGLHADKPARTTLISALLLGAKGGEGSAELWRDFQRAGLAHVLAISGANVGVFLLGVWWLGRFLCGRPGRVAAAVVAVVFLFLLAVPDDTPVLRAGLMAVLLAAAHGLGRPLSGMFALGLSALVLLLWRPEELFSPGFQLSFAAVGALFLFAEPVADKVEAWLTGRLPIESGERPSNLRLAWRKLFRLGVEAAVAGVVVFLAVLPILMFHFDVLSPLAALFSLAAAPAAALLMWVGYAKIALGLAWVPLGGMLAWPTEACADALAWIVHGAARCPGAQVALVKPAGPGPACAALAGTWAALWLWGRATDAGPEGTAAGRLRRFASAPLAPWLVLFLALSGLCAEQVLAWRALRCPPGLRLHEAAVGDGSCILLENRGGAVLFDCGSRDLPHPGGRVAVPVLRRLGVRALDAIVVSHADLDHFGGMLEVADAFPVKAAYLGPSVWDDAARRPAGACGVLVEGLRARGVPCLPIVRGWRMEVGGQAQLEALWPAADFPAGNRDNDRAVVLRASCGAQSALLCADLEGAGMRGLFACEPDLRAQVADLPHHGGFVKESPRWLEKVAPLDVIQSSSLLRYDSEMSRQWRPLLEKAYVRQAVTGRDGLVTVEVGGGQALVRPK